MEYLPSMEEAMRLLESGAALVLVNGTKKAAVRRDGGDAVLRGDHYSCRIPLEEFAQLYADSLFAIGECAAAEDLSIDERKDDEEYYRWPHK